MTEKNIAADPVRTSAVTWCALYAPNTVAAYVVDERLSTVIFPVAHGNSVSKAGNRVALQDAAEMVVSIVKQLVTPGRSHSASAAANTVELMEAVPTVEVEV